MMSSLSLMMILNSLIEMKKLFFGIGVLATMVASLTGCSKFGFEGPKAIEYHTVEFFCAAPGDGVRTVLTGSDTDRSREVYWQVGDQILVFDAANPIGVLSSALTADDIFDSIDDETSKATLSPSGEVVGKYARFTVEMAGACAGPFYAFYGISAENVKSVNLADNPEQSSFDVVLPSGQKYHPTGFAQWENPAVAYCPADQEKKSFHFVNLCGILELKINKPDDIAAGAVLTNVEIYDNNKADLEGFLSGKFTVENIVEEDKPGSKVQSPSPVLARKLNGPDGGGARNKNLVIEGNGIDADSYDLYFIAPVGSFHEGFTYILTYSDGAKFKQTLKASSKKVVGGTEYGKAEILRGVITKIPIDKKATPIADPQVPVQTANCYTIAPLTGQTSIPAGQTYAIPVGYKGNGAQGNGGTEAGASDYSNATGLYCAKSFPISGGAKAEVLWQTKNSSTGIVTEHELVSGISYNAAKDQIIFTATGVEGNALVALKDADGNILWSWHLWITNKTSDEMGIELSNGVVVMDRNLGALSNSLDDGELTYGQQYQWGRKDPFQGASTEGSSTGYTNYYMMYPYQAVIVTETSGISLAMSIQEPHHISHGSDTWLISDDDDKYIGWTTDYKSLWDPCPVGWNIAKLDYFFENQGGILSPKDPTATGEFINEPGKRGFRLGTSTKFSFLPAAGRGEVNNLQLVGTDVFLWTAQRYAYSQAYALHLSNTRQELSSFGKYCSIPVRCMKCLEPATGVAAATTPTYGDGETINL